VLTDIGMHIALHTLRLSLRPFVAADAPEVRRLAGDARIAEFATAVPHPYPEGVAEQWIAGHGQAARERRELNYAVTLRDSGALVGSMSLLDIAPRHARAEIGYWIGVPYWGQGYASEAAARLVAHAHEEQGLTRITAHCLARNPASARVLEKAGLQAEGRRPLHVLQHGRYEDVLEFGCVLAGRAT
jgi:RimJ/RimL family protein N-acetyltransferase